MSNNMTINDLAILIKGEFNKVDEKFEKIDEKFEKIDKRFDKIESTMVTKNYLDEKLADLRGDLVVMIRKEDTKLQTLAEILRKRDIISEQELKQVLSHEPFQKLFI